MISSIAYIVILWATFIVASLLLAPKDTKRIFPIFTLAISCILIIAFGFQVWHPSLLLLFERNTTAIASGQWWRVFTALFFQDGGVSGALFNIIALLFLGSMAEQLLKRWQWLLAFFGTGILTEFVALAWQPIGAGNSIANFGLAAGLIVFALMSKKTSLRILAGISILGALLLLSIHDIHGAAFFIGIIIFLILGTLDSVSKKNSFRQPCSSWALE